MDFLDKKEQIALKLEDMYSKFGFKKYKMSRFEEYSFYMENETFLNDNRVITFYGPNGKLLALKPDITMSIVKNCLKTANENHKVYYNESVFRIPKDGDEFKEIHQIGVEFIGKISTYQTMEIFNLAKRSLVQIDENYMLCISNMGLILKLFEKLNLNAIQKSKILHNMKQKNTHDLEKYLESEKINDLGILTKLLNLDSDIERGTKQLEEIFKEADYSVEIEEMKNISKFLPEIIEKNKISIDFSHISCTEYYNGIIFTGYIHGVAIPSLTGGRYDKLLGKMGIFNKSALGFAVDLSAVEKILLNQKMEVLTVKYDENSDILKLLRTSNEFFEEGKTFCITD